MDVLAPRRHHKRSESYSNKRQPVSFYLGYSNKSLNDDHHDDDPIDPAESAGNDFYSNVDADDDNIHWNPDKLSRLEQRRPSMSRMESASTVVSTSGYTNLKARMNRAPSTASEASQFSHGSSISTSTLVDVNSRGKAEPHIITIPVNRRASTSSILSSQRLDEVGPVDTVQPIDSVSNQDLPNLASAKRTRAKSSQDSLEKNNLMNLSELTHQVDFINENMTSSISSGSERHSKLSLSSGSTESLPGYDNAHLSKKQQSAALPVSPPLSPPLFAATGTNQVLQHQPFERSDTSLELSAAKSRFFENFADEEISIADETEIDFDQRTISHPHSRTSSRQSNVASDAVHHPVYPGISSSSNSSLRVSTIRNALFEDEDQNDREDAAFLSRLSKSNFGLGSTCGITASSHPGSPMPSSPSSDHHCSIQPRVPSDNGLIPINLEPVSPLLLAAAVTESSESLVSLQQKAVSELQLEEHETITDKFHQRPLLADPDKPFIPCSPVFPDIDELFREYYPELMKNSLDYEHHKGRLMRNRVKLRRLSKSITDYEEERRRKISLNKLHSQTSTRAHVHGF